MNSRYIKKISLTGVLAIALTSCINDLDRQPFYDVTSNVVYQSAAGYKQALAKVYGSFATTGNNGPAGQGDLGGIDEGTSDFFRLFWNAEQLPTDETITAWNGDAGLQDFHMMNWSADNPFLRGLFNRSYYQITLANEFLRESTDSKLSSRGISGAEATEIKFQAAEARFLRAYQYWVLVDLFGNVPFVDENSPIGASLPPQKDRVALFNYVESELKAIESLLKDPKTNEYGRADKAAAWALLARLYLNAEVYTGTAKYAEAAVYAKKVINAGYTLTPKYKDLFVADNNVAGKSEIILSINYDGAKTQGYGGTTFLVNGSVGGSMDKNVSGTSSGWGGHRSTKNLPLQFPTPLSSPDKRAMFVDNDGMDINEAKDVISFSKGYACIKFKNLKSDGSFSSNMSTGFSDTDFPLFRLAEMHLIVAEVALRAGNTTEALAAVNTLRARAYETTAAGQLTTIDLNELLNERSRELYWEGFRRTDLIRFHKFVEGSYLWPWKGGAPTGSSVQDYRNLYPLPSADVTANPNLVQNPNY
ncbi:RagB/SusD family nutrient uptake outer membrane protein [Solitalea sp. MAHUQ-68]|uniref:RagB/SusD family nutrient uptake outer membrane protein n=1 Tax=Solitalea agri TaxID=2953739 RepID=A0A9X2JGF6_9SPHI|nr:RagB/SusD family nutrient uptake outer membrane protein [Solitalea agri]MCO4294386.1 RagB/SusD family nutrient uptake outer membrane protein [Solitalea agri]